MNLSGPDGFAPEGKSSRGARVVQDRALKPMIESRTGGRINAHVSHHPGDDQMADFAGGEMIEKLCIPEAVGEVFPDDSLIVGWFDAGMDLHSVGAGNKKGCTRADGHVLNMHEGQVFFSKDRQHVFGSFAGLSASFEAHSSTGEIIILNVDEQKRCVHDVLSFGFQIQPHKS